LFVGGKGYWSQSGRNSGSVPRSRGSLAACQAW